MCTTTEDREDSIVLPPIPSNVAYTDDPQVRE